MKNWSICFQKIQMRLSWKNSSKKLLFKIIYLWWNPLFFTNWLFFFLLLLFHYLWWEISYHRRFPCSSVVGRPMKRPCLGFWAARSSGRCPCQCWEGRNQMIFKVSSSLNHSMIVWFTCQWWKREVFGPKTEMRVPLAFSSHNVPTSAPHLWAQACPRTPQKWAEISWNVILIECIDIHRSAVRSNSAVQRLWDSVLFLLVIIFCSKSVLSKDGIQRLLKPTEKIPQAEFSWNLENPGIYCF